MQAKQKQQDIALFELLQAGDENAFAEIRELYYHTVYLNSFYILKDRAEAEDVAQEIFIELWNKKNLIHIESNLSGYLNKAAYTRSVNKLNRKQRADRRELMYIESTDTVIEQPGPTVYDDMLESLKEAIKDLPEMSRRSIEMVYWEKRSHKEVAQITGLSVNTIKTQIYNSLKSIRSKLRIK